MVSSRIWIDGLFQLGKLKGEARLEALRAGGVAVNDWLEKANAQVALQEEEEQQQLSRASVSMRSDSNGGTEIDVSRHGYRNVHILKVRSVDG